MLTLDRLLDGLEVDVEPFAICEVRDGGLLQLGNREHATLHYTLAGTGLFKIDSWSDIPASDGTILVVPANCTHRLTQSGKQAREIPHCAPLTSEWQLHRDGSGPDGILVACGQISASYKGVFGLFDYLHEPLVGNLVDQPLLRNALEGLIRELTHPRPGTRALARALLQQCLIELMRAHYENDHQDIRWLSAAENPRLWKVIKLIFDHPESPHSLDTLASYAGMSRSSLVDHFSASFERSPMDLVKELRLRKATSLLTGTELPIKSIATRIGYSSRTYFTRAFKQQFKQSPGEFRSNNR
jgi:AraC-like DNA-binding protein